MGKIERKRKKGEVKRKRWILIKERENEEGTGDKRLNTGGRIRRKAPTKEKE